MRTSGQKAWALVAIALVASLACDKPIPVAPAEGGLSVSANPTRIAVDGVADITVIARKMDGSAVNPGTEINFATDLGTITPKIALTNDRGIAEATLRGDGRVGVATIEVSSGSLVATPLEITIGSRPATITLQANPARIPESGGTSTLVASVADDLGNALDDVVVRFNTEAGTLDSRGGAVRTNSAGDAADTLTLTAFDVDGVIEGLFLVAAETIGTDGLPLAAEFDMEIGGFVQTIVLTPSPGTISVTGEPPVTLNALVLDDGGDGVVGVGVVFGSDLGTLLSAGRQVPTDSDGVATDLLTVSPVDLDAFGQSSFQVRASVPGLGGDLVEGTNRILISTSEGIIVLTASPTRVECETAAIVTLEALVIDNAGAPAEGESVSFDYQSTLTPGFISNTTVLTNIDGIATTTLVLDGDDLPCTGLDVIPSFNVEATVILLLTPQTAVASIGVDGTS